METLKKKLDDIRASQKEIEAKKKKCVILFKEQMANIAKPRKSTVQQLIVTKLAVKFDNLKACLTYINTYSRF